LLVGIELKLLPNIVIVEPTLPDVGEKEEIIGGGFQIKPAKLLLPPGAVTTTLPEEPDPTIAVISVEDFKVNCAAIVPPIFTRVAPVKQVPLMVITEASVPTKG